MMELSFIVFVCITATVAQPFKLLNDKPQMFEVNSLHKCPHDFLPMGCIKGDKTQFSELILTGRDKTSSKCASKPIVWENYQQWLPDFICECAKKLFEVRNEASSTQYIAIAFYAECWALSTQLAAPSLNTTSKRCDNTAFQPVKNDTKLRCQSVSGRADAIFVYKVTKKPDDLKMCGNYFVSIGCKTFEASKHDADYAKPLEISFQGLSLKPSELFCECANAAKKNGYRYFSVDKQQQCYVWENVEPFFKDTNECRLYKDMKKQCPTAEQTGCQTINENHLCIGNYSNILYLYEVVQGPLGCKSNPCSNGGKCFSSSPNQFSCECPKGTFGPTCEKADGECDGLDYLEF